jgi:predicted dehydrogenase
LNHELRFFLDACARRRPLVADVKAGLLALRVVEATHRSSKLGRRVLLSELNY